jgi:hypothetical protein
MNPEWQNKIELAQTLTHYTSDGIKYPRIPYGQEDARWGEIPCNDCGVTRGQFHVPECEYELCPKCRKAMSGHLCRFDELPVEDDEAARKRWRRVEVGLMWTVSLIALVALIAFIRGLGLF